jgi:hypothetical protein
MSDKLHSFTPLHDVLQRAQRFFDTAAALLAEWAEEDDGGRTGSFLKVATEHEQTVADSLARALDHEGDIDLASADTVYQNPPETIPSEDDLRALASQRQDLETFAASLHALHHQWVAVFEALQATNPTRRLDELLGSCRELIERLERHLSSAQVQLRDL